jgi:hypothetical protein
VVSKRNYDVSSNNGGNTMFRVDFFYTAIAAAFLIPAAVFFPDYQILSAIGVLYVLMCVSIVVFVGTLYPGYWMVSMRVLVIMAIALILSVAPLYLLMADYMASLPPWNSLENPSFNGPKIILACASSMISGAFAGFAFWGLVEDLVESTDEEHQS